MNWRLGGFQVAEFEYIDKIELGQFWWDLYSDFAQN